MRHRAIADREIVLDSFGALAVGRSQRSSVVPACRSFHGRPTATEHLSSLRSSVSSTRLHICPSALSGIRVRGLPRLDLARGLPDPGARLLVPSSQLFPHAPNPKTECSSAFPSSCHLDRFQPLTAILPEPHPHAWVDLRRFQPNRNWLRDTGQ